MSTIACPNCGKPLRAGARFCGNCGTTLPAPVRPAAPPPPSDVSCPHCGKPLRQGARFCSSCGRTVDLSAAAPIEVPAGGSTDGSGELQVGAPLGPISPVDAPTDASAKAETLAGSSSPETRRATPPPAPTAQPPLPARTPAPATGQGRRLGIGLALASVLVCLGVLAGSYFLANQMGWLEGLSLASGSPTSVVALAPQATSAAPPTPEAPAAALPAATSTPQTAALPAVPLSTAPLITAPATASLETAMPVTATPPAPIFPAPELTSVVLFEDNFDNGLSGYWRTWGSPRPLISRGPGDAWLSLKALEVPTSGGVSTRPDFVVFNEPGAEVELEAQLDSNYPAGVLLFDWDPMDQFDRGPENDDPGLIHMEVRKDQLLLQTGMSGEKCSQAIDGQVKHIYTLRIEAEQAMQLYLDGQPASICSITDMGLEPMAGTISFSGLGWITRVKVSLP